MNTPRLLFLALVLLALAFLALATPMARASAPVIVRVTTSGTTAWPCGDETNWSNPCALQTALSNTFSGGELWVAAGTYTPTMGVTRTATFQLRDGIALYGGFAGSETSRSQRNFVTNVTILSGDIGVPGDANDNAYHVVTATGVTNTAVLDGFTVTDGKADGDGVYQQEVGGGMYNFFSNPVLTNITFSSNQAHNGGGMANDYSDPILINVTFSGNSATVTGGGMYNSGSSPPLNKVTFSNNSAAYGGGMVNVDCSAPLTNVTFISNTASNQGGGMYNSVSSPPLNNATFSGNSATDGGGIYNSNYSSPTIHNTIFWGNTASNGAQIDNLYSTPDVSYSVVQGGCPNSTICTNIITTDPRLGTLGYWGGNIQTFPLLPGSSAIDTGDDTHCPPTDQRGVPRPVGAHCDIGAFEGVLSLTSLPLIRR